MLTPLSAPLSAPITASTETPTLTADLIALHEVTLELAGYDGEDALHRRAVELACIRLHYDRAALFLVDVQGGALIGTYGTDPSGTVRSEYQFYEEDEPTRWTHEVDRMGGAILWEDAPLYDWEDQVGTGWKAAAALTHEGRTLGYLIIDNLTRQAAPRPYEIDLLKRYAGALAFLIALLRRRQRAADTALDHQRLRVALQKEQEWSELKTRMMIRIAHEFRTPLAIISLTAETIERYFDRISPEQRVVKLAQIRQQVRELTVRLEDINAIRHVPQAMAQRRITFGVREILQDVVLHLTQYEAAARVQVFIAPDAATVTADRYLLDTALTHIVSNALKYSPADQPIHIHVRRESDDIVIDIIDTGIGIPDEEMPHIFDPFFRAHNVEVTRGLGLGLSIARQALYAHGGTLLLRSRLGAGTTATLRLPA